MRILLSIQPKWCKLIEQGLKELEIRKSAPHIELPAECLIYCSKNGSKEDKDYASNRAGKIIGKFTCDYVRSFKPFFYEGFWMPTGDLYGSCLSEQDLRSYSNEGARTLWAWHIQNFELFDSPRELSDFQLIRPPQSYFYIPEG